MLCTPSRTEQQPPRDPASNSNFLFCFTSTRFTFLPYDHFMENSDPRSKRTLRRTSNSHASMSDNESTTSQADSWHSTLRSPFSSDDPYLQAEKPRSEKHSSENAEPPSTLGDRKQREKTGSENHKGKSNSQVVLGLVRNEPVKKSGSVCGVGGVGGGGLEEGYVGEREEDATVERAAGNMLRRSERTAAVRRVELMFRVFEMIACLISFSVMAADRTQGWSGDSFDRYIEYRYCLAVNIIGFAYSSFQVYSSSYYLATGKHVISHHLRYHLCFLMDQILAYLLISASSSAATRVTDWISNWGKDEFTLMASASISLSFLAFIAFALSSLISGSNLGGN